ISDPSETAEESPRTDGSGNAQFGTITAADAAALKAMGDGNNVPGHVFTTDGNAPHLPDPSDHFPDTQTNTVGFPVSIGTFNAQQQSDIHAYWEFNRGPRLDLPGLRASLYRWHPWHIPGGTGGCLEFGRSRFRPVRGQEQPGGFW